MVKQQAHHNVGTYLWQYFAVISNINVLETYRRHVPTLWRYCVWEI